MVDENNAKSAESSEACSAVEAVKRAMAELAKAQAYYEEVCQQARQRINSVRESQVGDVIDGTLEMVKRRPGASITIAALLGFLLGRMFRRGR